MTQSPAAASPLETPPLETSPLETSPLETAPETPLARLIAGMIEQEGPISLERYMDLALYHPLYGYYCSKMPLGAEGDFTTAPEISQIFGELIGLWAAQVWQSLGAPARIAVVELGPGRGTLMADFLRAARILPAFRDAIELHLVEANPVLRERQEKALEASALPLIWHHSVDMFLADRERLPATERAPMLCIANEFFDCLPLRQFVRTDMNRAGMGWHERLVGLGPAGGFAFGLAAEASPELANIGAAPGSVLEINAGAISLMHRLAGHLTDTGGAMLVVDYGHAAKPGSFGGGETLQALRHHRRADPLAAPGEADLTAHVDFTRLAEAARAAGALTCGPLPQGEFLLRLGLAERTEALTRRASPAQAQALRIAAARLTQARFMTDTGAEQDGMGALFKVLAVTGPDLPIPPGF